MTATSKAAVFAITFTISYAVLYTICVEVNLPLVTYHPVLGEVDLWWKPERRGPAMYWYGWMLTALIGAFAVALIATITPEKWIQRVVMVGCLAALAYAVVYSLALFVYERATIELEPLKSRWLSLSVAIVAAGILSWFIPAQWNERLRPAWTWIVPLGALAVLGYYLTPFFTR
jgi:drug/metabolite transporter (DMT)-like permease